MERALLPCFLEEFTPCSLLVVIASPPLGGVPLVYR